VYIHNLDLALIEECTLHLYQGYWFNILSMHRTEWRLYSA